MGFSQGYFIWSEKVELKENYTKWNFFFLTYSKDHTCRLLIPKIIVKTKIFLCNFQDPTLKMETLLTNAYTFLDQNSKLF